MAITKVTITYTGDQLDLLLTILQSAAKGKHAGMVSLYEHSRDSWRGVSN